MGQADGGKVMARLCHELGDRVVEESVPHRSAAVRLQSGFPLVRHQWPPPRLVCWILGACGRDRGRTWVPGRIERELWELVDGERSLREIGAASSACAEELRDLLGAWARRGVIWLEIR